MRDARLKERAPQGTCQLLGRSLVSWSSKKQNSVALSTAKVEYISTGSCCAQILWMKATLSDFGIKFKKVPFPMWQWECNQVDQQSGSTWKNKTHWCPPPFYKRSSTKRDICIESVGTEDQLADIFTKLLDEKMFCKLRNELNILDFSNICWCIPTHMTCLSFEQSKVKVDWHGIHPC